MGGQVVKRIAGVTDRIQRIDSERSYWTGLIVVCY